MDKFDSSERNKNARYICGRFFRALYLLLHINWQTLKKINLLKRFVTNILFHAYLINVMSNEKQTWICCILAKRDHFDAVTCRWNWLCETQIDAHVVCVCVFFVCAVCTQCCALILHWSNIAICVQVSRCRLCVHIHMLHKINERNYWACSLNYLDELR